MIMSLDVLAPVCVCICIYIYIYIFFFSNKSIITYLDSCPIILCLDLNLVECRVR